jgi:hypothetical protein
VNKELVMKMLRYLLLTLALGGCMTGPANGDNLATVDTPVDFVGYTTVQSGVVVIEAGPTTNGPFSAIGYTTADRIPIDTSSDGWTFYQWRASGLPIPLAYWGYEGTNRVVYARSYSILSNNQPFYHYTFDNAATSPRHENWQSCIGREWSTKHQPLQTAVNICKSSNSPLARITTPCVGLDCPCLSFDTLQGDWMISSPQDILAHRCTNHITGNLTINPMANATIPHLAQVDGNVILPLAPVGGTNQLPNISAPALTTVGGAVQIHVNQFPTGGMLQLGLDQLSQVGNGVSIQAMTQTVAISGLPALTTAPSVSMQFDGNVQIVGLLPNLATVTGDVTVSNSIGLHGLLPGLQSVHGNLSIAYRGGAMLPADDIGLGHLATVGGTLHLENTPWAGWSGPAPAFRMLTSVAGSLEVVGTSLTTLDLGASRLAVGSVYVDGNTLLGAVTPTRIAVGSGGDITIVNNPALPECNAQAFITAQTNAGWTGTSFTDGNDTTATCP